MHIHDFDVKRAVLKKKDIFKRFKVEGEGEPLRDAVRKGLMRMEDEVLVMERAGQRLSFSVAQIDFHHVAEGELAGQPYMVAF